MGNDIVRIMLKIGDATIEVEGSESYVDKKLQDPGSFDSLIEKVGGTVKFAPSKKEGKDKPMLKEKRKAKKPSEKEGYEIVKDLVLTAEGDKPSLKEFCSQTNPRSNYEHNAVFSYYLLKVQEKKPIGVNDIYTCYKEVRKRVPIIAVSLSETSRKGWLDTSDMSDIKITPRGENFVEHDLPKVKKPK